MNLREPHPIFGRVVVDPGSKTTAPQMWQEFLLGFLPLCIADLRAKAPSELEAVRQRALEQIASHGDVAQFGGKGKAEARVGIAQGLAILAFTEGGVTALGIHACVKAHEGCPGSIEKEN
ncbi:hypothetical protein ACIRVF_11410 [Kitasatospora sp. NPDC101157]|uniref:hypothetical protein n=1 Tax=Kitasatospora sp. NPDC101157 TaxID=3364098 RepID=UPI00381F1C50